MFKVDFHKAFDTVRWDHLDDILGKFGFGNKWRGGLRQRDPLSPFLFILVMESLHVSFQRLIDRGMFDPIFVGKYNMVPISHLFYADDAMLIVNFHKSSIYGVGVRLADVQRMAVSFGCLGNNLPFTYLGVKVGANMMRLNSWSDMVKKMSYKLSTWKAKTLSVGGRLALLKSVLGAIPTYYMSLFKAPEGIVSHLENMRNTFFLGADIDDRKITWVSWNKVLAHKSQGGLGVTSLYALNLALIFKCIWIFLSSSSSLWINVIKSIHGNSSALDNQSSSRLRNSTWIGILKAINKLNKVDLMGSCKLVIGNGSSTRFWHDRWYGDVFLKEKFKRLFNLELQKDASVASKLQIPNVASTFRSPRSGIENSQHSELVQMLSSVSLSSACDRWSWTIHGLGEFLVKSAREEIDKHVLVVPPSHSRWSNPYNRGIHIACVLCPNCGAAIENRNHLFFDCSMFVDLAQLIGCWWNIHIPSFGDPSLWETWFNGLNISSLQKRILEATFVFMWWHIWKFRNSSLFSLKKPRKEVIFDDIVSHTFFWVKFFKLLSSIMSAITDIRCVLTQKALDAICDKFYIPEENNHFFWVDDFACPASFPWHTAKHVNMDHDPAAADFNAQDYTTLVAYPTMFWKFPKAFLCLVGLSRHYTLDEETYPRVFIRTEMVEMDIFAFIHTLDPTKVRVVERERNEDEPRLLDTTVGRTVPLLSLTPDRADSEQEASVERLFDEGGSGTQTEQGDSTKGGLDANIQLVVEAANIFVEDAAPVQARRQGKRKFVVVDAGGVSHPPKKLRKDHGTPSVAFIGAFVSTTLKREDGDHTDFVAEPNLRTIRAPQRSYVPIMTAVTTVTSTVDSALVAKEKHVKPSLFSADSFSAGGADPNNGVFSDLTGSDFLDQLFIEFNVGAARQMSLSAEVRMRSEYNVKERRRLKSVVENQGELLKAREEEIKGLKARLLLKEAKAAEAIRLRTEASNFKIVEKSFRDETNALRKQRELIDLNALVNSVKSQDDNLMKRISSCGLQEKVTVYENYMKQLEKFQDDRMKIVNDKFDNLYTDFVEMTLHLEEKIYPHLLTTIFGRRWLLTQGMKLGIIKCLNSPEYLFSLGAAIGKAIEKGMQDGLSVGITHGKEGRLQYVNFPFLAELRSNKDASEVAMNILRLEGPLADKLGFQLMVPIHHSSDKVVIGATALSLALHVSNIRVRKIKQNIANQRSTLHDVFIPLSDPLCAAVLTGTKDAEDQAAADGNAASFLDVDHAELNIVR
nr:RNA-directed DNA polymerase, eukaryota, reverse transcriptase zinc-binding domain protein [Tanacetum cinerariifolium]